MKVFCDELYHRNVYHQYSSQASRQSPLAIQSNPALQIACVAWRFCRAGRRSGVAAPPQSARGFSALARLYYLTRPTKTAMLRRLLCRRLVITDSFQKSPYIFSKFNPLYTDTPLIRTIPTVYSPFCVCLTVVPFCLVVLRNKIWAFFH